MKKIYLTILFTLAASVGMSWATENSIVINGTPQVGDNSISLTYYFDPANVPGIDQFAPTLKVKRVEDGNFDEEWLSLHSISSGTMTINLSNLGSFQAGKTYQICFAYYNGSWVDEVFQSFTTNVYTVAGSSTAVFGTAWDTGNEANNMVLNAGVYTLTKEDVTLPVGTIEFKVVTNHAWSPSYPANNYELNISEAGIYDIEISFDLSQGNNGVSAVATKVGEAVVIPTVSIAGEFNSWSTSANVLSDDGTNHLTCSGTISLTPGWYEFKVVSDGSWLSVGPGEGEAGDLHQMSRRYYSKLGLTTGRKNLLLLADVAGDYEFVYTYATHDLVISAPDFVREAANTNYQSLCTPFDATIDGATAYTVGTASASGVSINPVVGNLEAGHSYIIKPAAVGTISINYVTDGDVTINSVEPNGTGLYGVLIEDYVYSYAYESTKDKPWVNVFALLNDDMFHQVVSGGSVTITPTHAYLHIEGQEIVPNQGAPGIRIIETATNIENIEGNETAVKFIENGKLFIKKNGVVYDAVGTVVK